MMKFYYDESEHSRKINEKTVMQENYYDNFLAVIVGFDEIVESEIEKKYEIFESKFSYRKSCGELKSTTIKPKQLKNGFASLTNDNLELVEAFFEIFDEKIFLYFSVTSKMEYLVNQLFRGYKNNIFQDADALRYSIVKSIVMYQPEEIIHGIYEDTLGLVDLIKKFYKQKIELNQQNPKLKLRENQAFEQAIILLDDIEEDFEIDWDYHISFYGFKNYLEEHGIMEISLFLDKEAEESRTLLAAKETGINNIAELDSEESVGIRIADMLVGLFGKLLKSLHDAKKYYDSNDSLNKKLLGKEWFNLSKRQLFLYKKMNYIISDLNNSWYKSFSGIYADDFLSLVTLINYFSSFDNIKEMQAYTFEEHQERLNSTLVTRLAEHFKNIHSKFPVIPISPTDKDYFYTQRGAKVYFDDEKQPLLNLEEGSHKYLVLNAGFSSEFTPTVTIQEGDSVNCYRLPKKFLEWSNHCVAMANVGMNIFPAEVIFSKEGDEYFADVL